MQEQEQPESESQQLSPDDSADKAPPLQTKKPGGKLRSILSKALFALTLVAAIAFAGLWWYERTNADTAPSSQVATQDADKKADTATQPCPDAFTHYTNKDYKLEFCYPRAWGNITVNDERGPVAESGRLAELTFTNKSDRRLSLPTHDWQMLAGHGGCGFPPPRDAGQIDGWSSGGWSSTYGTPDSTAHVWPEPDDGSNRLVHAERAILEDDMPYLIKESISTHEYLQGVCINGYKILNGDTYKVATATLSAEFNDQINTPQKHVESPNTLVSANERADFAKFVKSIKLHQD